MNGRPTTSCFLCLVADQWWCPNLRALTLYYSLTCFVNPITVDETVQRNLEWIKVETETYYHFCLAWYRCLKSAFFSVPNGMANSCDGDKTTEERTVNQLTAVEDKVKPL